MQYFSLIMLVLSLSGCAETLDAFGIIEMPKYCSEVTEWCYTSKERQEAKDKETLEKYCSVYPEDRYYKAPVSIHPKYKFTGKVETVKDRWHSICDPKPNRVKSKSEITLEKGKPWCEALLSGYSKNKSIYDICRDSIVSITSLGIEEDKKQDRTNVIYYNGSDIDKIKSKKITKTDLLDFYNRLDSCTEYSELHEKIGELGYKISAEIVPDEKKLFFKRSQGMLYCGTLAQSTPKKGCLYSQHAGLSAIQNIDDGYIFGMQANISDKGMFIYKENLNKTYSYNKQLEKGYYYYLGNNKFETILGWDKTLPIYKKLNFNGNIFEDIYIFDGKSK